MRAAPLPIPTPLSLAPPFLSAVGSVPSRSGSSQRGSRVGRTRHSSNCDDDSNDGGDDEFDDEDEDEDGEGGGYQRPPLPSAAASTAASMSDERAQVLYPVFVDVCTTYRATQPHPTKSTPPIHPDPAYVSTLVSRVYELMAVDKQKATPPATAPLPAARGKSKAKPRSRSKRRRKEGVCEVCYEPIVQVTLEESEESKRMDRAEMALTMPGCGHDQVCNSCLAGYLTSRISSNDVAAWIPCPHPDCMQPVPPSVLTYPGLMSSTTLLLLLQSFLIKTLSRSTAFIPCTTSLCPYAFFSLTTSAVAQTCPLCRKEQTVERGKAEELDPAFKAMISAGTLRNCPACAHWTMKEKGICNVLECAKCGVCTHRSTRMPLQHCHV